MNSATTVLQPSSTKLISTRTVSSQASQLIAISENSEEDGLAMSKLAVAKSSWSTKRRISQGLATRSTLAFLRVTNFSGKHLFRVRHEWVATVSGNLPLEM